jgi:hypothetical protein
MRRNKGASIIAFLLRSKSVLLEQPVVGLYPDSIFGKVLWAGEGRTLKYMVPSLSGKS